MRDNAAYTHVRACDKWRNDRLRNFRRLPDCIIHFRIYGDIVQLMLFSLQSDFGDLRFRKDAAKSRGCAAGAGAERRTTFPAMVVLLMVIGS
jgi:hypothetical protein